MMPKAAVDSAVPQDALARRNALRTQVEATVEQLSRLVVRDGNPHTAASGSCTEVAALQASVQFLGQALAAWPELAPEAFPAEGAGFGSSVDVEDLDTGVEDTYTLMAGPLLDLDAGQVSLASPIGQALLGARSGMVVSIRTPQRLRRLRVVAVRTLHEKVRAHAPTRSAA